MQLIQEAQEVFYIGRLTVAHAFEIARLQPNDQRRAPQECFPNHKTTAAILKDGNAEAVSKMRGIMSRIYKIGILHEHVAKNPVQHVETCSKSDYKAIVITPAQTLAILKALPSPLHCTLVLTCAATALRASEMLALRWRDVLWNEGRIRISKRWSEGKDGATKTEASDGYVPLHPVLAAH